MKPIWRRNGALALVVITLIGWPLSAMTWAATSWAANEPQFVLGLSWLAITLTCLDIAATTDVRAEQEGDDR